MIMTAKYNVQGMTGFVKLPRKIGAVVFLTVALGGCGVRTDHVIDYLGQKPPGVTAELFAPGVISTKLYEHSAPAFSPDGNLVLWTIVDKRYRASLYEMRFEGGKWSTPYRPSFADTTVDDFYPSFSDDGVKLYFSSRRKMPEGYAATRDMRIWQVERNENGWTAAVPFDTTISQGMEYAHSISKSGTLYFSNRQRRGTGMNVHKAVVSNGKYVPSIILPYNINSVGYEDGPYIAPDESFLIFESVRPECTSDNVDLFITFRTNEGGWGLPINMGPDVNSESAERFARMSPDGKYLFFGSNRNMSEDNWGFDIYWIDAGFINELRTQSVLFDQSLGAEVIQALDDENTDASARSLNKWIDLYPGSVDANMIYASVLRKLAHFKEARDIIVRSVPQWDTKVPAIVEMALINFGMDKNREGEQLLIRPVNEGKLSRDNFIYLSNALFAMKKYEKSDEYFAKALSIHSNGVTIYNRGCSYARAGEPSKAFHYLNRAVEQGYDSKQHFESDPDLASLRSEPAWTKLARKLK
jgi:Tol biopolymer transport system component